MVPFAGWEMPVEYSGIAKEHTAVRTAAGLFDVSHMGEFEVRGPEALDLIQHITTNDVSKLVDGQAQYSAIAYPHGTVVDDLLVYRHSAEHFMLVVNASNIGKDFEWVNSHNRVDATVENISDDLALLAVQGPKAIEIAQPLVDVQLSEVVRYHFVQGRSATWMQLFRAPDTLARTDLSFIFPPLNPSTFGIRILEQALDLACCLRV